MDQVRWAEIDGVATAWVESGGPLTACLSFRAGRADETLLTAGHLHLLEHLVASSLGHPLHPFGASLGALLTRFTASGTPGQVVAFLGGVCAGITSLPLERMEAEKKVLAAEAATRAGQAGGEPYTRLYGARGFGLLGLEEIGLPGATREDLESLARTHFTSGNALLCLTGPPPPGLRLPLPRGPRVPPPMLEPWLGQRPGYFVGSGRGAAALSIVPWVAATPLLAELVSRRMRDRLRTELGLSYAPAVSWEPFSPSAAHVYLTADSVPERALELADAFLDVVGDLGNVQARQLTPLRDHLSRSWREALAGRLEDVAWQRLVEACQDWTFGGPFEPTEVRIARAVEAPLEDVRSLALALQENAVFSVPSGLRIRQSMGAHVDHEAPASTAVDGRVVLHRDSPIQKLFLVHGRDGVSLRLGDAATTVRYGTLAAATAHADGRVALYGTDGCVLVIEPSLWADGPAVVEAILSRIPESALVRLEARSAAFIPRSVTTPGQRFLARFAFLGAGVARMKRLGAPGLALATGLILLAAWGILAGVPALLPMPTAENLVRVVPPLVFWIAAGFLALHRRRR